MKACSDELAAHRQRQAAWHTKESNLTQALGHPIPLLAGALAGDIGDCDIHVTIGQGEAGEEGAKNRDLPMYTHRY